MDRRTFIRLAGGGIASGAGGALGACSAGYPADAVAAWQGPGPSDDLRPTTELVGDLPDGVPFYLYHGDDDDDVPQSHIGLFEKALPHAIIRRLEGRNHQLNDDLSDVAHDIRLLK